MSDVKHTEGKMRAEGCWIWLGDAVVASTRNGGAHFSPAEQEANAARFVLCWNEFPELVEAVEELLQFVEGTERGNPDAKSARALLTRIREAQL